MPTKDTSIADLGESIKDMGSMVVEQINLTKTELGGRMDSLETGLGGRMDKLERNQVETNSHLDKIDDRLETIENDIKALYSLLTSVQKDTTMLRQNDKKLDLRIRDLEDFAQALSQKTGIPFRT